MGSAVSWTARENKDLLIYENCQLGLLHTRLLSAVCLCFTSCSRCEVFVFQCCRFLSDALKMRDLHQEDYRAESPGSSCLSMKSDWSKAQPPVFNTEPGLSDTK